MLRYFNLRYHEKTFEEEIVAKKTVMSELFLSPQVKKSCCLIRNSNLKRNDKVMNGKDVFIERPKQQRNTDIRNHGR